MSEGVKIKAFQTYQDYNEDMWTVAVGEAAKRFTTEEIEEGGAAWDWVQSVVDLIQGQASG